MTALDSPNKSKSITKATVAPNFITEIMERDLQSGQYQQIVTRFPPEPSGYPHLGHVFASFLSFQLANQYGGRYHLRMDDTNPELATQKFVDVIAEDLKWLGWDWGEHFYYASDDFEKYYQYAERLIKQGDAYVDSVSPEEMIRLRGDSRTDGTPSEFRSRSVEENLEMFRQMRAGTFADGEHVLRAKIDLASPNIKLRDPVLYRILRGNHYRKGTEWCIYPMYDFQHPLQDAIEGITHSLCSLEFIDNRAIYDWLMEKLGFNPRPHQYEFGRRGLEYTITSKRKLRKLVQDGHVAGWDDPRMPTLRAQRRLGVTPEAIKTFAAQIGVNRTNRTIDIAVYENAVREDLNHRAPRVMAVLNPLRVTISNLDESKMLSLPYWPHDVVRDSPDGLVLLPSGERVKPEEAVREVPLTRDIYIEHEDFHADPPKGFKRLKPGGTVRLRGVGVVKADRYDTDDQGRIIHIHVTLLDENASASGVIHWVSAEQNRAAEFRLYDRLFKVAHPEGEADDDIVPQFDPEQIGHEDESKPVDAGYIRHLNPNSLKVSQGFVELSVSQNPSDTRYQFERNGYFWQDPEESRPEAPVFNRIITLKDAWGKVQQKEAALEKKPNKPAKPPKQIKQEAPKAVELTPEQATEMTRLTGLGVSEANAQTIARDSQLLAFLAKAKQDGSFGQVASWVVNDLVSVVRADEIKISAEALAPLADMLAKGEINSKVARQALAKAAQSGDAPTEIIEREGLNAGLSAEELNKAVQDVIEANPDKVEAYRGGKTGLIGFFTGQVMRATGGKADPKQLKEMLEAEL